MRSMRLLQFLCDRRNNSRLYQPLKEGPTSGDNNRKEQRKGSAIRSSSASRSCASIAEEAHERTARRCLLFSFIGLQATNRNIATLTPHYMKKQKKAKPSQT